MARKFFRRFLPDNDAIRANRHMAWMVRWPWLNHPNLWHLNRRSVAGGFAIGLFAGMVPGPVQMLVAALIAIPLKKNLPIAMLTTFYTNPFTIAPLYVLAYGYGRLLLAASDRPAAPLQPFEWIWGHWFDSMQALIHWSIGLGKPLAIGLLALALTFSALGYAAVQIGWRIHVRLAWRRRAARRSEKNTN